MRPLTLILLFGFLIGLLACSGGAASSTAGDEDHSDLDLYPWPDGDRNLNGDVEDRDGDSDDERFDRDSPDGDIVDGDGFDGEQDVDYELPPPGDVCLEIDGRLDLGCDGVFDRACITRRSDIHGREVESWRDDDCDGTPDSFCSTTSYDDAARSTLETADDDCDGVADLCTTRFFDAYGRVERLEIDQGCLAETSACQWIGYQTASQERASGFDQDCDGTLDSLCVFETFDAAGLLILEREEPACDGTAQRCLAYSYDEWGGLTRLVHDEGCDGSPENCYVFTNDAAGRVVSEARDMDCDDSLDFDCISRAFDEQGRLASEYLDDDCDGTPEHCTDVSSDTQGRRVETLSDCGERIWACITRRLDAEGRLLEVRDDRECDDSSDPNDRCDTYTYDAAGNRSEQSTDLACDGVPDECRAWNYACFAVAD